MYLGLHYNVSFKDYGYRLQYSLECFCDKGSVPFCFEMGALISDAYEFELGLLKPGTNLFLKIYSILTNLSFD